MATGRCDLAGYEMEICSRATILRAMQVTGKIIYQPVIDNIRNILLSKLLKQGGMADSIKRFAEVETDDNNVGVNRQ